MNEKPRVSLIAAITKTRAIGRGNDLIVRIPDDLKRFRALTRGHAIVMGRKTYESIGRTLPDRANIVVSRDPELEIPGATVLHDLPSALEAARQTETGHESPEVFVIGGAQIYEQALPYADRLYLTLVDSDETGDAFFPEYPGFEKVVHREDRVDDGTGLKYSWIDLER